MRCLDSEVSLKPPGHRGRELGIHPDPGHEAGVVRSFAGRCGHLRLSRYNGVIELLCRVEEARSDVVRLEVRILGKDVLGGLPSGKQLKDIDHANAHPADTGAPAALVRIDRDSGKKFGLVHTMPQLGARDSAPVKIHPGGSRRRGEMVRPANGVVFQRRRYSAINEGTPTACGIRCKRLLDGGKMCFRCPG